jgi:hypothetical protein
MEKSISFIDTSLLNNNIEIVMRQTNYSFEEAKEKLLEHNNDHIKVIKLFLGIQDKQYGIKSINQEIYKQLRHKMDSSIREYNQKKQTEMETM